MVKDNIETGKEVILNKKE